MKQHSNEQPALDETVALNEFIERLGRDDEAKNNLAGLFDVLIQMDFALKEQKPESKQEISSEDSNE